MREIIFYRTSSGHCPVEKFLDFLPSKHAKKVAWVLSLIEDLPIVPQHYFKKLVNTDDIWEVRVKSGGESYRLLGFFDGSNIVVLDYAFQKKTNAGTKPATQTGLCGPQISALIRAFSADDFSCFFVQRITCKALTPPQKIQSRLLKNEKESISKGGWEMSDLQKLYCKT